MNELSYEEAITELEAILSALKEGQLSLRDSIEKYKQGMELYHHCKSLLTSAELEIQMILKNETDEIKMIPFDLEE